MRAHLVRVRVGGRVRVRGRVSVRVRVRVSASVRAGIEEQRGRLVRLRLRV